MAQAVKTEDLIARLAREAGPVAVLASPAARTGRWLLAAALAVAAVLRLSGLWPDVWPAMGPVYGGLAALSLGAGVSAGSMAFVLGVPGAERSGRGRALAAGLVIVWGLSLVSLSAAGPAGQVAAAGALAGACEAKIALLSLVPAAVMVVMLRRAAPLQPVWAGALALFAAAALASVGAQLVCPSRVPLHGLLGHFLPVIVMAALGAVAGRRLLEGRLSRSV